VTKAAAADARFWRDTEQGDGCWEWKGYKRPDGYGSIWNGETNVLAHRYSWELARGPVPDGLGLDHICRNRACVKPTHLEPVTQSTNLSRMPPRSVCKKGHPLVPGNVYLYPKSGARLCITCHPERRPNWFPDEEQP